MTRDVSVIAFSKDRAMQLDGTLRSFLQHCGDGEHAQIQVLFAASTQRYLSQYQQLQQDYPQIIFKQEQSFKSDLLEMAVLPYLLFLVDDNIFVRDFSLAELRTGLQNQRRALGASLRLGRNTTYCYSLDRQQPAPAFETAGPLLRYAWPQTACDFGYPLEVSSSFYRTADILPVLKTIDFKNPNSLEGNLAPNAGLFERSLPHLLCFESSITFCNPANKVQNVAPDNRAGAESFYSSENLADLFDRNLRIATGCYSGFVPNACHQEVPLYFALKTSSPRTTAEISSSARPLISVIIPCYRQAHYLAEAVQSVAQQSYGDWECIIVNDGSPDDTGNLARKLVQELGRGNLFLLEQDNMGLAEARNTGIRAAKGQWILPLDSDDKIAPDYLKRIAEVSRTEPEIDVVYCNLQMFGAKQDLLVPPAAPTMDLFRQGNVYAYASAFKKDLWERAGHYLPIIPFGCEDYNFWIYCMKAGMKARHLNETLFYYRRPQGATMVDDVNEHYQEVMACVHTCHPDVFDPLLLLQDHEVLAAMNVKTCERIERTIRQFPQHGQPYLWRGLKSEQEGKWQEALHDFGKAAERAAPGDWQPFFRLALLMSEHMGAAKARDFADETLRRCPQFPLKDGLNRIIALSSPADSIE